MSLPLLDQLRLILEHSHNAYTFRYRCKGLHIIIEKMPDKSIIRTSPSSPRWPARAEALRRRRSRASQAQRRSTTKARSVQVEPQTESAAIWHRQAPPVATPAKPRRPCSNTTPTRPGRRSSSADSSLASAGSRTKCRSSAS